MLFPVTELPYNFITMSSQAAPRKENKGLVLLTRTGTRINVLRAALRPTSPLETLGGKEHSYTNTRVHAHLEGIVG